MFCIGNFDYVAANKVVLFEHQQVQCIDIQILSDDLTENQEIFAVDLMNGKDILSSTIVIIRKNSMFA